METRIHPVQISFKLPVNSEKKTDRVVMSYLIRGERICLVDAGPAGSEQRIVDALTGLGWLVADISMVINTHEHPDHIGGNSFFEAVANPTFACHAEAVRWIETLDIQLKERPIYSFHTLAGKQGVHIQRRLQDGDLIDLGDKMTLEVIFCPGHSPGSISLFSPIEGALITGDAVQPVDGLPLYKDLTRTRASLKKLMGLTGVEKMYVSWIEKPYTGSEIKEVFKASLDYLDRVDAIVKDVRGRLRRDSPEELTREVLIRLNLNPPPVMPITIASIMSHLSS